MCVLVMRFGCIRVHINSFKCTYTYTGHAMVCMRRGALRVATLFHKETKFESFVQFILKQPGRVMPEHVCCTAVRSSVHIHAFSYMHGMRQNEHLELQVIANQLSTKIAAKRTLKEHANPFRRWGAVYKTSTPDGYSQRTHCFTCTHLH
jgi:hypothetical protein